LVKKSQDDDLVRTIVSTASTYLFEGIFGKINEELMLVLGKVEKRGYQIQERMLERMFSFLTLTLACLFVVLGVYSFLLEYLKLTNSAAYIIVGAALLLAYYLMNKRQRFGKKIEED
jgi:FtsH-binding integral membrane protein